MSSKLRRVSKVLTNILFYLVLAIALFFLILVIAMKKIGMMQLLYLAISLESYNQPPWKIMSPSIQVIIKLKILKLNRLSLLKVAPRR